jgi:hypothetical protein
MPLPFYAVNSIPKPLVPAFKTPRPAPRPPPSPRGPGSAIAAALSFAVYYELKVENPEPTIILSSVAFGIFEAKPSAFPRTSAPTKYLKF